mmetsp:Transcript_76190/g.221203  ORF Transcript_76190/g.221203 Transcript_76190/m.221203 type:complete len:282 (+) Transcript_76190:709-1554(+)
MQRLRRCSLPEVWRHRAYATLQGLAILFQGHELVQVHPLEVLALGHHKRSEPRGAIGEAELVIQGHHDVTDEVQQPPEPRALAAQDRRLDLAPDVVPQGAHRRRRKNRDGKRDPELTDDHVPAYLGVDPHAGVAHDRKMHDVPATHHPQLIVPHADDDAREEANPRSHDRRRGIVLYEEAEAAHAEHEGVDNHGRSFRSAWGEAPGASSEQREARREHDCLPEGHPPRGAGDEVRANGDRGEAEADVEGGPRGLHARLDLSLHPVDDELADCIVCRHDSGA